MFLKKHDDYDIDPDEPWRGDKLKRQQTAEYLTPIIASIDQPFVISLNAEYGMGKTDFVRRWQHDLNNRGFKTAYFNAWESDFSENALAAFMSSLKSQLIEQTEGTIQKSIKSRIGNLAKKSGGFLRHQAAPMLARAAVRKFLGEEEFQTLKGFELNEEDIENLTSALAIEALAAQEAAERSMVSFRNEVEELVVALTKTEEDPAKRKLIIFVDELDRCRPNYALEVLEAIKHLFSVPGVIFILAVDETQLRETVKTVYGSDMNGPGYFSRFFDWRLQLPTPDFYAFATHLMSLYGIDNAECFQVPAEDNDFLNVLMLVAWFAETASHLGLSPRQQIRSFTEINLVIRSTPGDQNPFCPILGFLAALKAVYPDECRSFCLKKGNVARSKEVLFEALTSMKCPLLFNGALKLATIIGDWEREKIQLREVEKDLENFQDSFEFLKQPATREDRARFQNLHSVRSHLQSSVTTPPELGSLLATVYSRLERASIILK